MSRPTSLSVRPGRSHSPIRACTRSIAAPAARSAATSSGALRIRSGPHHRAGQLCTAAGSAARSASTLAACM